jgi:hypothetical protein
MTTGHFIMDIADSDDHMHEIEIEYEITRIHDEVSVEMRVVGSVPPSLGLSRSSIIHLATDLFWERDLITEFGDDDQPYFE